MGELTIDPNDGVQLARPGQAARLAGISRRTIYNWIEAGKVRVRYAASGVVLIEVNSLFVAHRPEHARIGRPKIVRPTGGGDLQPAA